MSKHTKRPNRSRIAVLATALFAFGLISIPVALADTGAVSPDGGTPPPSGGGQPGSAKLVSGSSVGSKCDKVAQYDPATTPPQIAAALDAGNRICDKPYIWGGGHGKWEDNGYDCSGTVSYLLHAANVLSSPLDSGSLARLIKKGKGKKGKKKWKKGIGSWITVAANGGHTYIVVDGLRMDTSGSGGKGPRWFDSNVHTSTNGPFKILHPKKF